MAFTPISLITIQYQNPSDNTPYSGAVLKAYAAGTSTNIVMSTDSTGATTFTSVALNSSGNPEHLGATIIPHIDQAYKMALYANQAAADADTPSVWSIDNLLPLTISGSFTTNDAISGAVTDVLEMTHTTTGTPTTGIGTGISFTTETAIDNNETGMTLDAVTTDISAASEDFDFVVNLMAGGAAAAEVFRVTSAGVVTASGTSFGVGDALVANPLSQFAATTSAQLAGVISDETGTGVAVFSTSPTLITPALGTPASGVVTNLTGTGTGLTSGITNALKSATTTVDVAAATAPTTGQILTATGTTAATWQDAAAGGSMVLLSTVTASASATVDIETTFDSTYDAYILEITGLTAATNNVTLSMQMKLAGAYATSLYRYHVQKNTSLGATYSAVSSAADTSVSMADQVGNNAADSMDFQVKIANPASTAFKKIVMFRGSGFYTASARVHHIIGSCSNDGTGALTGLRFALSSGNIAAGDFRLYGIAKT